MTDKIDEIFGQLASLADSLREPRVINAVVERLNEITVWLDGSTRWQDPSHGQEDGAGLYVFWLDGGAVEMKRLKELWESPKSPVIKSRPKIISSRFDEWVHNRLENGNDGEMRRIPMYLGKTKSLSYRVNQHVGHGADRTTYSLKLKASLDLNKFRIGYSTWKVPRESKEHIDIAWMLQILESGVRRELQPFIGRQ